VNVTLLDLDVSSSSSSSSSSCDSLESSLCDVTQMDISFACSSFIEEM